MKPKPAFTVGDYVSVVTNSKARDVWSPTAIHTVTRVFKRYCVLSNGDKYTLVGHPYPHLDFSRFRIRSTIKGDEEAVDAIERRKLDGRALARARDEKECQFYEMLESMKPNAAGLVEVPAATFDTMRRSIRNGLMIEELDSWEAP